MCMETEGETESVNFVIPIPKHTYVCTRKHSTVSQDPCDLLTCIQHGIVNYLLLT